MFDTKTLNFSYIDLIGEENFLHLQSNTNDLFGDYVAIIERNKKTGNGKLNIYNKNKAVDKTHILGDCHYHYKSSTILAAISFCDNTVV